MPKTKKVYIASPTFSEAERLFNLTLEEICREEGFTPCISQMGIIQLGENDKQEVFGAELHALEAADLIVANLDGADVDSGTAWKMGYAIARGKSVIGLRTDSRRYSEYDRVSLVIEESLFLVRDLDLLRKALRAFGEDV